MCLIFLLLILYDDTDSFVLDGVDVTGYPIFKEEKVSIINSGSLSFLFHILIILLLCCSHSSDGRCRRPLHLQIRLITASLGRQGILILLIASIQERFWQLWFHPLVKEYISLIQCSLHFLLIVYNCKNTCWSTFYT